MKIVFYGDSNTYGFDPRDFFGGRYEDDIVWTNRVASAYGKERVVINEGMNGRCIPARESEYRYIERILESLDTEDVFAVMLGTNDLLRNMSPDAAVPVRRMENFLKWITDRGSRPCVLLIAPPYIGSGPRCYEELARFHDENILMNNGFRALARKYEVMFNDASEWEIDLAYDGVHFSEEGHRRFAERMIRLLNAKEEYADDKS